MADLDARAELKKSVLMYCNRGMSLASFLDCLQPFSKSPDAALRQLSKDMFSILHNDFADERAIYEEHPLHRDWEAVVDFLSGHGGVSEVPI